MDREDKTVVYINPETVSFRSLTAQSAERERERERKPPPVLYI